MHDLETAGFKDIFVGAALWKALGVPSYEFSADPVKFQKLQTLAKFLNNHPDPTWAIDRIRNNKTNMSNLDFLTSYALLNQKKAEMSNGLKQVEDEIKPYENG
jgi:hypothetical protein